jgi:hypothetical protein
VRKERLKAAITGAWGVEPHYDFEVTDAQTLLDLVDIDLRAALFSEAIATSRNAVAPRQEGTIRTGLCGGHYEPADGMRDPSDVL